MLDSPLGRMVCYRADGSLVLDNYEALVTELYVERCRLAYPSWTIYWERAS